MEKVLPSVEPTLEEANGSMFLNEEYHLQLAFYTNADCLGYFPLTVKAEGALAPYIRFYKQQLVPFTTAWKPADDYYIAEKPCLIPDPLLDFGALKFCLQSGQWRAVWVSIRLPEGFAAGRYETKFSLCNSAGAELETLSYSMEVIGARLPENPLRLTNWLYCDCIAERHNVKPFSKAFYKVFDSYLKTYVASGYNMLLTPLFTPPLDTEIGKERLTTQLVGVSMVNGEYVFDFSALKKFISFALERGVKYIEFSHLFTQWGGKACPKIIAKVNGKNKRVFGWDVPSDDSRYVDFLKAFLPALTAVIDEMDIRKICYFHLTDEPRAEHLETYKKCAELVKDYIGDMPIMDALSHYEFFEKGLLDVPVVYTPKYEEFAPHNLKDMMVYNCCIPATEYYSNRFIHSPSQRTRVLGFQLYESGVQGYLHWGFNFYNAWRSYERGLDPYSNTDSDGPFPSGDAFLVYPTKTGACPSIRSMVAFDGFQDYRAMLLLESFVGREEALKMLQAWGLTGYKTYNRDAVSHANFRKKINETIKNCLKE